jgi:uncharacterized protein GlcG (DUF336 family)
MTSVDQIDATVTEIRTITLAGGQQGIAASLVKARELGARVAVVVLDAGGNVQALARMDGAPAVATDVAQNKANTALVVRMPTHDFAEAIRQDAVLLSSLASQPGMALFSGGLPLISAGTPVGAIGVSGGMGDDDMLVASAGAAVILHADA